MNGLLKVSLRQQAVILPGTAQKNGMGLTAATAALVANMAKLGYGVTGTLLNALNNASEEVQKEVLHTLRDVMGTNKNWTPLVKGWNIPTGESLTDHIITAFTNTFGLKGTVLPCGHLIPDNTFPLDRYNGCPFCGTPFEFEEELKYIAKGSTLKVLDLWTITDAQAFMVALLMSKTALDATQTDSLKSLMNVLPLPVVPIGMKETKMLVIDILVEREDADKAQVLFTSPVDVLRYLWYKHTGFLQIIEPKTIIKRQGKNNKHRATNQDKAEVARFFSRAILKLKYNRRECLMVARWLNNMDMDIEAMCEAMHPKRAMWVRFIRGLRLAEYSKRAGFEKLKELLDYFYHGAYTVWQGRVNSYTLKYDAEKTFAVLKQRPGLFARSLFANMLWFGAEDTIDAFKEVMDKVPARLIITLGMYAQNYFDRSQIRTVRPLGGISKSIANNKFLAGYHAAELNAMITSVEDLSAEVITRRFAAMATTNKTMYIDPMLYKMPLSIGDRSDTVQDMPVALQGARFPVEGDNVRLFMQWGTGLKAQHLDMDLSCTIAYADKTDICSFSNLVTTGCKHSGDIREIPNNVGTAEYIDIDIKALQKAAAKYVVFSCNAYSVGTLTLNLSVGWMNSKYPMKISAKSGVAYDPSCVQHQVRIVNNLSKGLVFGVLELATREVIWMEIPFGGQIAGNLNLQIVTGMLQRLNSKQTIGQLLEIKAKAQGLVLTTTEDADEMYTKDWAMNTAAVTQLLID